jgi:starch-binding outer membrane protein SusE/F
MKTLKIFLALILSAFVFAACEDDDLVTLNPSAALEPTASETEVVLTKELEGTDVLNISWPEPAYGFTAYPTYIIYLDIEGGDFEAPIAINNEGKLSKSLKAEELNKHLINLGFEPGEATGLKIRVEARLGTYESLTSEVMTVNATAYTSFLDLSTTWGVVGSGYNNWGAFPDAPFFTTKTTNELVAYVTLIDGQIKFRENNEWANNFGDNNADGTLENGGADITVTAGPKKITFNPVAKTYSIIDFAWGIVGSAYNDWGAAGPDFKFTYDDATDQWRAIVELMDGKFKIRKNNDWGLNYGDTGADGSLEENGTDIDVEAGKYQITFNENDLTIVIEEIPNIWGLVGSAYNDWGNAGPDAQFDRDWRNDGVWILRNVTLVDGKFKIRDSNDWGLNYGDTNADGSLESGGTDIDAQAGIYTITLDFSNADSPTWSMVKH